MYENIEYTTIKKIKPIVLMLLIATLSILAIPIASVILAIVVVLLLLFITIAPTLLLFTLLLYAANYIFLNINRKIIKKKLYPILKEAKHMYDVDIINFEHIVYYKNNHITSIKIPIRFKNISSAIKSFKEKTGSLDSEYLSNQVCKANAINCVKMDTGNIFFSTIQYNNHIKKNIHLYDLRKLDSKEMESLYSTSLSDEQKFLISKKYCLD